MKLAVLALAATLVSTSAWADDYPTKPIRVVVGYTPGGAADAIARVFGEALGKRLGQTIVIDNKPGAGSTLASTTLANAAPDGYTLGLATGTLYGLDQHLYPVKYAAESFTPIARLTTSPLVLAVNRKLGVNTIAELADRIKANPGKMNYSSSGVGGSPHIAALMFEKAVGGDMMHVPYKGGSPAIVAVASGEVDLSFGTASSVLPLGRKGTITMLGVSTLTASAVVPELPPIAESGLPGFDFSFWFGLFGPAKLPAEIADKLLKATNEVLADEDVQKKLVATGNEAAPMKTSAEFGEWAAQSGKVALERAMAAGVKGE